MINLPNISTCMSPVDVHFVHCRDLFSVNVVGGGGRSIMIKHVYFYPKDLLCEEKANRYLFSG